MKTSIFITVFVFWFANGFSQPTILEPTKTTEFKVYGNCSMCKSRIEQAAKTEGVLSAIWQEKTKMLKVEYTPSKVSLESIHQNIAKVGHDTGKAKANDEVYNKLPGCCKYDRPNKAVEKKHKDHQH